MADRGSKALFEITSKRKHIYVQRIATIFQTGEHGSPLQYNNKIVTFIKSDFICNLHRYLRAADDRPYGFVTFIKFVLTYNLYHYLQAYTVRPYI